MKVLVIRFDSRGAKVMHDMRPLSEEVPSSVWQHDLTTVAEDFGMPIEKFLEKVNPYIYSQDICEAHFFTDG